MKKSVDRKTKNRAKHLRKNASPVERLFWCRIRAGQLHGLRIRRQHPIGPYIADFYVPRLGLVIELDGDSHDFRVKKDRVRDRYMEVQGLTVLRFQNRDIMKRLDSVLEYLWNYCEECLHRPSGSAASDTSFPRSSGRGNGGPVGE